LQRCDFKELKKNAAWLATLCF